MENNINNLNINEFEPIFNILEEKFLEYDASFASCILAQIKKDIISEIEKGY
jgi:hypothetical protein